MDNLITASEAATLLGVSDQTVINWLKQGRIKGQKVGRTWAIPQTALEKVERPKMGRPPEKASNGNG